MQHLLLLALVATCIQLTVSKPGQCVLSSNEHKCSALQVCPHGECCSYWGYCGVGKNHCSADLCISQCDQSAIPNLPTCGADPKPPTPAPTSTPPPSRVTTVTVTVSVCPTPPPGPKFPTPPQDARGWVPSPQLPEGNFARDEFGMYQSCGWNGMFAYTLNGGPHKVHTADYLQQAKDANVKLTHFWVGQNIADNEKVAKRVIAAGHHIGSHTFTHADLNWLTNSQLTEEIENTEAEIMYLLGRGKRPRFFRPPYGSMNERTYNTLTKLYGYQIIHWDLNPHDLDEEETVSSIVKYFNSNVGDSNQVSHISVSHEDNIKSVQAFPKVLDTIKARGFTLVPMYMCLNDIPYN